jgi:hypothetical protein
MRAWATCVMVGFHVNRCGLHRDLRSHGSKSVRYRGRAGFSLPMASLVGSSDDNRDLFEFLGRWNPAPCDEGKTKSSDLQRVTDREAVRLFCGT